MHGSRPMRRLPAPTGMPLLVLLVVAVSPLGVANSLRKLGDASSSSLNDDMDRYALLMLDAAGGADTLPSIALPRRITAKSVFIAPSVRPKQPPPCQDGYKRDGSGACVRLVNVDTKNTWEFFVQKLNQQFGGRDPFPQIAAEAQTAAEAQAAAEAAEAVAVATQVAAEASPPALEPLHFRIPIESVPEVTTTEPPSTESTTPVATTTPADVTTTTVPVETSFEPEVILYDGEKTPPLSLALAPVVVAEPEVPGSTAPSPTWTSTPAATTPAAPYSFKTDTEADADPIINSVSDSPLLAGLKRLSPIVVAELPEWPSPSPSAAAAAAPLDASAVPPRRRPSSSFVRFPGTTEALAAPSSSKPVVFPSDHDDDPPRRLFFPDPAPAPAPAAAAASSFTTSAGRRFSTARTHSH